MFKKIISLNNDTKIILENILSLYVVQGLNYLIPLIVLPYLVRTIGTRYYGLITFVISFASYFVVIVDYGFNLTATKKISSIKEDIQLISKYFFTTLTAKLILALTSLVIFSIIILLVPQFRKDILLFYISYLGVFGNFILPIWFFQGTERLKILAIINLISKGIVSVAIFSFIHNQSDYLLAMIFQVSSVLLAGLLCMAYIIKNNLVLWVRPSLRESVNDLKEGWFVFISQISVNLFSNTGIFILGLFHNNETVGYYAIADKVTKAIIGMVAPVCNAIYPRSCQLFSHSVESAKSFIGKVLVYGVVIFSFMSICLFIFADKIVVLITGYNNDTIVLLIKIMSLLPLTNFIDNVFGTQILLNIGESKEFMKAILYSGLFSVIMSLLFVPFFGCVASAINFSCTGVMIMTLMYLYVRRHGIRIFKYL
jgi:PST family polysaccharide transporter